MYISLYKKHYFFVILMLAVLVILPAQVLAQVPAQTPGQGQSVAAEIETLLNTRAVTYAQASRFVLEAADVLAASDANEAFNYAQENGWLPGNIAAEDEAQLNHISRLLMRSFQVKGGLLYSVTKSSRYAYRELIYISVIQGRVDATMPVSGERLLFYVGRMLAYKGGSK